ncbi:hypothetical protein BDV95DRAFT_592560 [Massariosphaeria phaeospora]|uniref:Uncharacterized protein n=1 Tax=Massariosphaeria phaeospora TaxID=100035 RepID=A0A7C8IHQ6_9PLEO|nr:hypothetical protein BDV95DRAFT_592560 [Massariosphaeria phaeospora]
MAALSPVTPTIRRTASPCSINVAPVKIKSTTLSISTLATHHDAMLAPCVWKHDFALATHASLTTTSPARLRKQDTHTMASVSAGGAGPSAGSVQTMQVNWGLRHGLATYPDSDDLAGMPGPNPTGTHSSYRLTAYSYLTCPISDQNACTQLGLTCRRHYQYGR